MENISLHIGKPFSVPDEYVKNNFIVHLNGISSSTNSSLTPFLLDYTDYKFWLNPLGKFNLVISEDILISKERNESIETILKAFEIFLNPFINLFIEVNKCMTENGKGTKPIADFSIFFNLSQKCTLVYVFEDLLSQEDYLTKMKGVKSYIFEVFENEVHFKKEIKNVHKVDDKTIFLLFEPDKAIWEITNLLYNLGKEKMLRVMENFDTRFSKSDMKVKGSNLTKEITFPNNWRITNTKRSYVMNKPNDIAMYSSIANKALKRGIKMYEKIHDKGVTNLILSDKASIEFFDYFEEIIQAIIMSFTTIECMTNTLIPFGYKFKKSKNGVTTIYDKQGIELNFSLKDKLKEIIPNALKIDSPVMETWWQLLIKLEKLRNEIIHSKEVKAEDRYSMFVNEKVFDIANVHNQIVSHYAKELCKAKSYIMNDFPVGVGCDEIIPSLISDNSYDNLIKILINPR